MPIIDISPYPWHLKEAQQLHVVLMQMSPTTQAALLLAAKAGIDPWNLNANQPVVHLWYEILNFAAPRGLTRPLVQQTHDILHAGSPHRPFLRQLLDRQSPTIDSEPRGDMSAPAFLKDTDEIFEPEALLYYDDLTIQVGKLPALISTLERLVTLAPAVCKLTVDVAGAIQYGTAFRVKGDRLVTNWHVLHDKKENRATRVTAEFGFDDDGAGGIVTPSPPVVCDVASIVSDKADDWAVINASPPLDARWPAIEINDNVVPVANSPAYIIQHPGGERKRIGFVRNQVSSFDDRVVHYLTDTQSGSSGAPVFDTQGRLIALHHAGGRPQEVLGRAPLKKNEGIRISRVKRGL